MRELWRRFRRWQLRDRIAFRNETERMWRSQLYRQALQWREQIERHYRESPATAQRVYGHASVDEALSDPEGMYQHHLQESQREWEPIV